MDAVRSFDEDVDRGMNHVGKVSFHAGFVLSHGERVDRPGLDLGGGTGGWQLDRPIERLLDL